MNSDITILPAHMREFALYSLGMALSWATFSEHSRPFGHAIALSTCANAAEVLIKARLAEAHPLLVFTRVPRPANNADFAREQLELRRLLDEGRTHMYADLPPILWAATGYRIADMLLYNEFGKVRNCVTHIAVPDEELSTLIIRYIVGVMQPMATQFWGEYILEYADHYDECTSEYLPEVLSDIGLKNGMEILRPLNAQL